MKIRFKIPDSESLWWDFLVLVGAVALGLLIAHWMN